MQRSESLRVTLGCIASLQYPKKGVGCHGYEASHGVGSGRPSRASDSHFSDVYFRILERGASSTSVHTALYEMLKRDEVRIKDGKLEIDGSRGTTKGVLSAMTNTPTPDPAKQPQKPATHQLMPSSKETLKDRLSRYRQI